MRSGQNITQPQGYKAFIPNPLPPQPPVAIQGELLQKLEQATALLNRLDGMAYTLPNPDLFISMYVKKEALLSAQIEGTQASLENVLTFEGDNVSETVNDVGDVINYIKTLHYGIDRLQKLPMSVRLIKELHAMLLQGVRGNDKTPGEFKRSQNWIGRPGCTLRDAQFIPPPPEEAHAAMSDLEKFMHQPSDLPLLVQCALIHYQFETIHPFLDGNGRVGRLLITFFLVWKGVMQKPLLYLSYYFKKNRQEYYDRLTMVRNNGDYEQWVNFFLEGVVQIAQDALQQTRSILDLHEKHKNLLYQKNISSPLAVKILERLFYTPLVSIGDVQSFFDINYQTAANLIEQFCQMGIVKEATGKKRGKRFVYSEYMEIVSEGTQPL
ncbi:MAG: Fic family protein [bacterium]